MLEIVTLTAVFLISGSECSQVIDLNDQEGLYISDYCPKIGNCGEGSHVMCLYDPFRVMGPACHNYVENGTITLDYAQIILGITNRIRSKIANGQVKVRKGISLPRGYGIFKVAWDEELATFAQVWANQCILRGDLCRASKRFPDVGQAVGMTRLSITDWMPIHDHNFTSSTLTADKVKYSITSILRAWWEMKRAITFEHVNKSIEPDVLHNKFLNLVYGPLTHIGCGISVYREYAYKDNNAHLNFNCVQVVCNFSSRPKLGQPVYTIEPPSQPGYTARCGCPVGYDEDEYCLCYESGRKLPCNKSACKPSLVVLPIFTTEDAPPAMIGDLTRRFPADVKRRYFNKQSEVSSISNTTKIPYRIGDIAQTRVKTYLPKKQRILAKIGIFELPVKKRKQLTMDIVHHVEQFKKDVAPRKDFSKVQRLVSSYLDKKRNSKSLDMKFDSKDYHEISKQNYYNNTIKAYENIKENSKNIAKFSEKKIDLNNLGFPNDNFKSNRNTNEESDKKLMFLLDELEQEIKNTDLNPQEKTMFDDKVRKIYDTLVGKPDLLRHKLKLLNNGSINETDDFNFNKLTGIDQMYKHNGLHLNKLNYRARYRDFDNKPMDTVLNSESYLDRTKENLFNENNLSFRHKNVEDTRFRNIHDVRMPSKGLYRNRHSTTDDEENYTLNSERRRYYQEMLANLQNKISNMNRSSRQKKILDDQMRQVRPTKQDLHQRRRKPNDHVSTYYMPDRARFLHGF